MKKRFPRSKPSPEERRGANRTETAALPAHSDASLTRPAAELPPAEAARGARRSAGRDPPELTRDSFVASASPEEDAGEETTVFERHPTRPRMSEEDEAACPRGT